MWVQSLSSALRHRGLPCSGEEQQAGSRQPTGASQAALSASGLCPGGKVTFHVMTEAGDALCSPVLGPEAEPHRSELWFLFPKPISPSPASSGSQQSIRRGGDMLAKPNPIRRARQSVFQNNTFALKGLNSPHTNCGGDISHFLPSAFSSSGVCCISARFSPSTENAALRGGSSSALHLQPQLITQIMGQCAVKAVVGAFRVRQGWAD